SAASMAGGGRWHQSVSHPSYGQDQLRVDLVVAEALAQPLYMHGDRVGAWDAAPERIPDLFPADDAVGIDHHRLERAPLRHGHPYQPPVEVYLERGRVEAQGAHLYRWTRLQALRADGAQDRQHLAQPVRVGHAGRRAGGERLHRHRTVTIADA